MRPMAGTCPGTHYPLLYQSRTGLKMVLIPGLVFLGCIGVEGDQSAQRLGFSLGFFFRAVNRTFRLSLGFRDQGLGFFESAVARGLQLGLDLPKGPCAHYYMLWP